jgi:hypothetical protein
MLIFVVKIKKSKQLANRQENDIIPGRGWRRE